MPNPETRQFIERMGLAIERLGMTRTFGRLFGLLMVAGKPLSLDDMVDRLGVSKASVSTNARACEELGLARQVGVRGDRKDYYEIAPGAFESVMAKRVGAIKAMADLASEGLRAVGEEPSIARDRLADMRDFYLFMGEEIEALLDRWREVKG